MSFCFKAQLATCYHCFRGVMPRCVGLASMRGIVNTAQLSFLGKQKWPVCREMAVQKKNRFNSEKTLNKYRNTGQATGQALVLWSVSLLSSQFLSLLFYMVNDRLAHMKLLTGPCCVCNPYLFTCCLQVF